MLRVNGVWAGELPEFFATRLWGMDVVLVNERRGIVCERARSAQRAEIANNERRNSECCLSGDEERHSHTLTQGVVAKRADARRAKGSDNARRCRDARQRLSPNCMTSSTFLLRLADPTRPVALPTRLTGRGLETI
jgi:hypothetical protein